MKHTYLFPALSILFLTAEAKLVDTEHLIQNYDGYSVETYHTYNDPSLDLIAEIPVEELKEPAAAEVPKSKEEVEPKKTDKVDPKKKPKVKMPVKKGPLNCEKCAESMQELIDGAVKDLEAEIDDLKSKIAELEVAQDSLTSDVENFGQQPSEEMQAKTNMLLVGTGYTFLTFPRHDNTTFGTVVDPVFLFRYGDNFLFEMKLDVQLLDCRTDIALVYGVLDYVVNDWLTVRAGKFSLPLGLVWEKMTTGWINKLPNLPLPYNPRGRALTPAADVGVDFRGAVEAGNWFGVGCEEDMPAVIAYDLWFGNGPQETIDGDIFLDCVDSLDNNYGKSVGARIGLRPQPFREIGFSFTRARWNNNDHGGFVSSHRRLYYNAAVVDMNWRFTENSKWMGEYIWTKRDAISRRKLGIPGGDLFQTGWWLQFSSFLNVFEGAFCLGVSEPFWSRIEWVVRGSQVFSDVCHFSRRQLSLGLNYYIENTLIIKGAFDINQGRLNRYNRGWIQLAYAY